MINIKFTKGKTLTRVFINMHDTSRNFIVDTIEPLKISSADDRNQPAFSKKEFLKYGTDNFKQQPFFVNGIATTFGTMRCGF